MASNQPEPSSSTETPHVQVGLQEAKAQVFCDHVTYVNSGGDVEEFQNDGFVNPYKTDGRLSPVVTYGHFTVDASEATSSAPTFVQVPIQSFSNHNGAISHTNHFEEPSDHEASQEQFANDLSTDDGRQLVQSLPVSQALVTNHSPESVSVEVTSPQVLSLQEESVDSHNSHIQDADALERISLDQLNLQHVSVLHHGGLAGLPIFLDRNSLAALMSTSRADSLCLDTTTLPRSIMSSQSIPQRTLQLNADQVQFLAAESSLASVSQGLLSPILSQREILPSMIVSSTASSSILNPTLSNSYHTPVTHKQMLVQKYTAELEAPSTSSSLMVDIRDQQLIESISDRVSSPYVTASSSNSLIDSHVFADHVGSLPSTSAGQCLPLDVYSIDRSVALVSSTRDSPEDLMNGDVEFSNVSHASSHPTSVHNYVSSSVDLVQPHPMDHSIHCTADSTVGPKLHPGDENIVDSSDAYVEHVDTSDDVLHTTSREDYVCHIADISSCDGVTAANVASVLNRSSSSLSANEALSSTSSHAFTMQYSSGITQDGRDDIHGCATVTSATHPDSTHSPVSLHDHMPNLIAHGDMGPHSPDALSSECLRPRRDLRTNKHWCEDCSLFYDKECPHHRIQLIFDKPVLSRAWASLPATYLYVNKMGLDDGDEPVYGVFAKKTIPKRTQFGPIEGVLVKRELPPSDSFFLIIEHEEGVPLYLDTSDESMSNWMRFVRPASSHKEQNLVIVQQGPSLYFNTTRAINPKTELRVWYSAAYAAKWKLPVLEPDEDERRVLQEQENAWPCFECNQRFSSSEDLQKHLNQHDEESGNMLDLAALRTRSKSRTRQKIVKKNPRIKMPCKQDDYRCEICHKVFPRNYSLQRHLIMHSGEKKYKCPICDMKFSHVYNRNRHVRRHKQREEEYLNNNVPNNKPSTKSLFKKRQGPEWICTHCGLTFDNSSVLNLHTLTHAAEDVGLSDLDPFLSSKCMMISDGHDGGSNENSKLGIDEIHECPECTQGFSNKRDLIEHASVHGKVGKQRCFRGIINPLKPFKCNLCYKSFASNDRLVRHYLVHGSEDSKPLQCDVCCKRFLNNSALACHVKVHSGEKKFYECPICKAEFDQIVLLKEHVHIHCENGVFNCPRCHKVFEEYNQIRKHIRAFHSERRYPCDKCEKIFPRPDKLKLHMLRHSDHREFLCANCGKQFKRKDKLKEHMKRMHAPEREGKIPSRTNKSTGSKKFVPKVSPTDYHRFIYKCHSCLLGFKRRGMLVNHLAKRHPDIRPESVPELNLPILKTTRDYYCQYCEKVYKSSSKRKAHILKNHPGQDLPMSNRRKGGVPEIPGMPNPTFSQTVGSITTHPHHCSWCHKQYASKAKLLQHQRKKHMDMLALSYVATAAKVEAMCDQGTQVTGQILIESVAGGITPETAAVLIANGKGKIRYVDRDALVATTHPDGLPTADLLTQAMSELTQNLGEYRTSPGEFLTTTAARLSQSAPNSVSNTSPSITPAPTPPSPTTISNPASPTISETISAPALDQIQLNQLLAQYQQQALSPQQLAAVVVTSVSRTWPTTVTATLNNYPAR